MLVIIFSELSQIIILTIHKQDIRVANIWSSCPTHEVFINKRAIFVSVSVTPHNCFLSLIEIELFILHMDCSQYLQAQVHAGAWCVQWGVKCAATDASFLDLYNNTVPWLHSWVIFMVDVYHLFYMPLYFRCCLFIEILHDICLFKIIPSNASPIRGVLKYCVIR